MKETAGGFQDLALAPFLRPPADRYAGLLIAPGTLENCNA